MAEEYYCYTLTTNKINHDVLENNLIQYFNNINYEIINDIIESEFDTIYGEIFDNIDTHNDTISIRFYESLNDTSNTPNKLKQAPVDVNIERELIYFDEEITLKNYKQKIELTDQCIILTDKTLIPDTKYSNSIYLAPKNTFGTGDHCSTQLAAKILAQYIDNTSKVLDVGCGTGILAIFAIKLGAVHVLAVDSDPSAIMEANAVMADNNATALITTKVNNFVDDLILQDYTHIVANLSLNLYEAFFTSLAGKISKEHHYIFSGIQQDQKTIFLTLLQQYEFVVEAEESKEGWVAFYVHKKQ